MIQQIPFYKDVTRPSHCYQRRRERIYKYYCERGYNCGNIKKFFNQTRKPEGVMGKIMLGTMNSGHAKLADWGLSHLPEMAPRNIVELGCGAGRNAGELLKRYSKAFVTVSITQSYLWKRQKNTTSLQLNPEGA